MNVVRSNAKKGGDRIYWTIIVNQRFSFFFSSWEGTKNGVSTKGKKGSDKKIVVALSFILRAPRVYTAAGADRCGAALHVTSTRRKHHALSFCLALSFNVYAVRTLFKVLFITY
jgi:hypothetical protein